MGNRLMLANRAGPNVPTLSGIHYTIIHTKTQHMFSSYGTDPIVLKIITEDFRLLSILFAVYNLRINLEQT